MTERKRPGPRKQYGDREDIHLKLPKMLLEQIDARTLNRTAWIVQAIEERLKREQEPS